MGQMIIKIVLSCALVGYGIFRLVWPKATLDFVALASFAFATVPWYAKWVWRKLPFDLSKVKITNAGFEVEIARRTAPEAEPAAVVTSDAGCRTGPDLNQAGGPAESALNKLHRAGDTLDQALSDENALVDIVVRMVEQIEELRVDDIRALLKEEAGGRRLAAYLRLYQLPDHSLRAELIECMARENIVFCQWWCLQALHLLKASITTEDRRKLRRQLKKLPSKSERFALLASLIETPKKRVQDRTTTPSPPSTASDRVLVG